MGGAKRNTGSKPYSNLYPGLHLAPSGCSFFILDLKLNGFAERAKPFNRSLFSKIFILRVTLMTMVHRQ
jgi:hypothetical protein